MSSTPLPPPAGWYPDPSAPGTVRYWDGAAWTPHQQTAPAARAASAAPRRSPGVDPQTVWVWLIALLPVVPSIMLLFVPWAQVFDYSGVLDDPALSIEVSLRLYTQPLYWASLVLALAIYGLTVWFAFLDHRTLLARGVDQPFHWAWQFLNPVYVIGRSIVAIRRTGRGAAPLWAVGAAVIVSLVISIVISAIAMDAVFSLIRETATYSHGFRG